MCSGDSGLLFWNAYCYCLVLCLLWEHLSHQQQKRSRLMTTCCCQGEKHHQTCKKITFSLIRPGMIFVYVFLRSFELQKSLRKTLSLILLNPYKTFKNIFEFRDNSIRFISCSTRLRRYETRGFFLLNQFRRFFQFLEDFVRHKRLKMYSWLMWNSGK